MLPRGRNFTTPAGIPAPAPRPQPRCAGAGRPPPCSQKRTSEIAFPRPEKPRPEIAKQKTGGRKDTRRNASVGRPDCKTARLAMRNGTYRNAKRHVPDGETARFTSRFWSENTVFSLFPVNIQGAVIAQSSPSSHYSHVSQRVTIARPKFAYLRPRASFFAEPPFLKCFSGIPSAALPYKKNIFWHGETRHARPQVHQEKCKEPPKLPREKCGTTLF